MSRQRKTSPAEDLVALVAMLPWWIGVVVALASYVMLHRLATQTVVMPTGPGAVGNIVVQTFWRTLAAFGQYALPTLCLVGSGLSAWRRRQRKTLLSNTTASNAADVLDGITWHQFETLVGEAFRLQGYRVEETGGGGADGGVDLVLSKGREKFLVQCKQWKAFKVGVDVVRELYGVMAAKGAAGGFVVTSGRFTDEATRFADGRNVKLVDGPALHALIRHAQASRDAQPMPRRGPPADATPKPSVDTPPACPACSSAMTKRVAKRGNNAGNEFWGCTPYPACRGTLPIR